MSILKTIQTLSKIGRILSKIVYICCVVGFCVCIVGIISLGLGILTISIPLGMVIVCSIGVAIADNFFPEIEKLSYDGYASVGLGVMMILSSLFCRYGAEVCDGKASLENIEHAES